MDDLVWLDRTLVERCESNLADGAMARWSIRSVCGCVQCYLCQDCASKVMANNHLVTCNTCGRTGSYSELFELKEITKWLGASA